MAACAAAGAVVPCGTADGGGVVYGASGITGQGWSGSDTSGPAIDTGGTGVVDRVGRGGHGGLSG